MLGQGSKWRAVYRVLAMSLVCAVSLIVSCFDLLAAETFFLAPNRQIGDVATIEVVMQVGGELHLPNPADAASLRKVPMSVAAKLVYDERLIALRKVDKGTSRAVRHYHSAKALVEIEKGEQKPTLESKFARIAIDTTEDETTLVSPNRALTRESLDLIDVAANTLVLDELLPAEPVVLGGVWKHSDHLLAALLRLDAVSLGDAQSMLSEVNKQQNAATISLAGTVHGAVGGVATEIELKARYTFDLKLRRITSIALLVKEKRSVGHVGPGLDVVAKQIVKIKPIDASEQLTDNAVATAQRALDEAVKLLAFESPHNRFRLQHDRRWFVTTDEKKLTIFRLVDRGELVAQCKVAALDPVPAGQTFALADFQRDIEKTLDKKFGQFVSAKEETDSAGRRVYRVVATGNVAELPILWLYYVFTTREGRRLSVAFTMEQGLVDRFGRADQQFLADLEIAPPQTAATSSPTPAKR